MCEKSSVYHADPALATMSTHSMSSTTSTTITTSTHSHKAHSDSPTDSVALMIETNIQLIQSRLKLACARGVEDVFSLGKDREIFRSAYQEYSETVGNIEENLCAYLTVGRESCVCVCVCVYIMALPFSPLSPTLYFFFPISPTTVQSLKLVGSDVKCTIRNDQLFVYSQLIVCLNYCATRCKEYAVDMCTVHAY